MVKWTEINLYLLVMLIWSSEFYTVVALVLILQLADQGYKFATKCDWAAWAR